MTFNLHEFFHCPSFVFIGQLCQECMLLLRYQVAEHFNFLAHLEQWECLLGEDTRQLTFLLSFNLSFTLIVFLQVPRCICLHLIKLGLSIIEMKA